MKGEKGFSLMEVALAIALLGVVAITYISALATGTRAVMIADERATAESLARAQIEYARSQEYVSAPWDYTVTSSDFDEPDKEGWWDDDPPPLLSGDYDTYTVIVSTEPLSGTVDNGIQVITVTIRNTISGETKEIFALEGYRAQRGI